MRESVGEMTGPPGLEPEEKEKKWSEGRQDHAGPW